MITLKDFTFDEETKLASYESGLIKVRYTRIQDGCIIEFERPNIGIKQYILKSLDDSEIQRAIETCIKDVDTNMRKYEKRFKEEGSRVLMDGLLFKNFL